MVTIIAIEPAAASPAEEGLAEDRAAVETAIAELRAINDGDDDKAINARSVTLIQAAATLGEDLYEAKQDETRENPAPKGKD
jgi:molecular chaperone DnaK